MKKIQGLIGLLFLLGILGLGACSSDFDVNLSEKKYTDSTAVKGKVRKVLYLIVDGARGWVVRDANATTINSLLPKSTYSWYSLSDSLANDENGWTDLMTGVTKLKHNVKDVGFTGNSLGTYPVFFKQIKSADPGIRIAALSASVAFKNNLTDYANVRAAFASDQEVKQAVVSELSNDSAHVVVGQFKSVDEAGKQYGYELSSTQYVGAIRQFDTYLGEMLTALKGRKSYAKEDWLVVITSNHGGQAAIPDAQNDNTILSYPKSNTFTILYNDGYKQKLIPKPFAGNKMPGKFVRFYSNNANTEAASVYAQTTSGVKDKLYDFGSNGSFTIEAKIRKIVKSGNNWSYEWPIFLGKKVIVPGTHDGQGWSMQLEYESWRWLAVNDKNNHQFYVGDPIRDQNWHHIAVTCYTNNSGQRVTQLYQDGKPVANAAGKGTSSFANHDISNSGILRMGYRSNGLNGNNVAHLFNGYVSDVRIWRLNLPDSTIAAYACDSKVLSSHPYYYDLVGSWSGTDGAGNIIKDDTQYENNLTLYPGSGATVQWTSLSDIVCPPSSANLGLMVPRTYDLPRQILSWLTMPIPETLKLDGRVFLNY